MPDITMCEGGDCPLKETCYRFTATPSEHRQSYFVVPPYDEKAPYNEKENKCDHYWEDVRHKKS